MKGQIYRQLRAIRTHQHTQPDRHTALLDNRLHYLNRSFEHNIKIQEIYLDIIKNKRTIRAGELKEYYKLFTNSKAEAVMFDHHLHQSDSQQIPQGNRDAAFALKRLYCRLIEKIMVKLSYYFMNKPAFNFAYAHASELMKKCEVLVRRLSNLKDLSNLNEIVERVFQENQQFQQFIFHELISRGYINSVDEFYRINGIDLEHREIYERNKDSEEDEDEEVEHVNPLEKKAKFKAKYDAVPKETPNFIKREAKAVAGLKNPNIVHRAGMAELQSKYKELIISLDKIITEEQQFQEIAEAKEVEEIEEIEEVEEVEEVDEHVETSRGQLSHSQHSQPVEARPPHSDQPVLQPRISKAKPLQMRHSSQSKTFTMRRGGSRNDTESIPQFDNRSQLHTKEITMLSMNSSSMIPEPTTRDRPRARKHTSPFFSKSFVNAIKTIDKSSLSDQSNRLSIKRMSQHILEFQKVSEKDVTSQRSAREKVNMVHAIKKSNHKKSIIKLLNIYKNRTLQHYVGQAKKELIESHKFAERIKQVSAFQEGGKGRSEHCQEVAIEGANPRDYALLKRTILRNKTKESNFKKESASKYKHLEQLKAHLKENLPEDNRTADLLKNLQYLENKIKPQNKYSIFQNGRLSQKLSVPNIYRVSEVRNSSLRNSPQRAPLQLTSVLTSSGIQSVDILEYRKEKQRMNKTVEISPTQTPLFPHFEVYDRIRRVVIK